MLYFLLHFHFEVLDVRHPLEAGHQSTLLQLDN